jgi:hypothetical protein
MSFEARFVNAENAILIEVHAVNFDAAEREARARLVELMKAMDTLDELLNWELKGVSLRA